MGDHDLVVVLGLGEVEAVGEKLTVVVDEDALLWSRGKLTSQPSRLSLVVSRRGSRVKDYCGQVGYYRRCSQV